MRKSFYPAASLIALAAVPCHAQATGSKNGASTSSSSDPQEIKAGAGDGRLSDIVVTAQRRSQRIERVPASVQVLTGAEIAAFRQTDLQSVSASIPNLVLTSSPSGAVSANIRGIGTSTSNSGFEQSVALYVDGIYQPRPHSYTGSLFDIDRIEVVKGTQGTLFGKNASVGAIGLYTRDPKSIFGGYLNVSYDFTLRGPRFEGGINLPASDTLRVRIAGLYSDQDRGWVRNLATGDKFPENTEYGIRGKADWDVTDNLTINAKLEFNKLDRVGNALALVPGNVVGGSVDIGDITTNTGSSRLADNGGSPGLHRRSNVQFIGATWNLGEHTITALTGWTSLRLGSFFDLDLTRGPIDFAVVFNERFQQFTQELRIASDESMPFEYIAGLFYLDQSLTYRTESRFAPAPADQTLSTDLKTYSGFIQGKYKFTDQLALTAGARVTNETKDGSLRASKNIGTAVTTGKIKTTNLDWNIIAEYRVQGGPQIYASVSRGNKAPGFLNTVPGRAIVPVQLIFDGEKATNYEVGIKSRFLDGRARANLAIYNLEVKDYQGSEFNPILNSFVASNVDVRSRGVEGELQLQVAPPLKLGFIGAYNDGTIKSTGNQLISAPRWNATVSFYYTPHLSGELIGLFNGQLNYTSKFPNQFDLQPGNFTPGRTNLDLRLGIKHEPTDVTLALIGRNVTNKRYVDFASGYPFAPPNTVFLDQIAKPRTIALELQIPFGR